MQEYEPQKAQGLVLLSAVIYLGKVFSFDRKPR